jgi:mono/diheme cytochrome c family protein
MFLKLKYTLIKNQAMSRNFNFGFIIFTCLLMVSCFDPSKPNYQYFPNMYESVGYETYEESKAFSNGFEMQLPVEGTIPRGWIPYEYEDTNEGYDLAKTNLFSPLKKDEKNLSQGKELYAIYCAVCHGSKGDGQGILTKREKFLGIPSYADRDITEGSVYHVLMHGRNLMGSHASQVDVKERWQITQYVMSLRENLVK